MKLLKPLLLICALALLAAGGYLLRAALFPAPAGGPAVAASTPAAAAPTTAQKPVVTLAKPAPAATRPAASTTKPASGLIRDLARAAGNAAALYPVAPSAGSEWTPDLYAEATKELAASARWSDVASSLGEGDILRVPAGVVLTYDSPTARPVKAIVVRGSLIFDPAVSTKMAVGTLFVSDKGKLTIEPAAGRSVDIAFRGSLDRQSDPAELLLGLVAVGGEVRIVGRQNGPAFAKASAAKGESVIHAASPVRWAPGDEIFLSQTGPATADPSYWWFNGADIASRKPFPEEWERVRVASVQGSDVYVDRPLAYYHDGYAADLSRSVYIHSDPTNPGKARGHAMFAGNVSVDVEGARLAGLGRTTVAHTDDTKFSAAGALTHAGANERGRYALHAHHLSQPFTFAGNVIDGSPKWGIVNHDSSGTVSGNVVVGAAGAGIVGEDGTETGVVAGNLVVGTGGGSGQNDDDRFGSSEGEDIGHGGFGYWFRGPFLSVRDNVAAGHFNEAAYLYFVHPQFVRNSLSSMPWIPEGLRGLAHADLVSREPIREFSGNVADGFFGNAGFMIFYSEVPDTISGFALRARGQGSTNGVIGRHIDKLTVADSKIAADASAGAGIVSSPDPGTVVLAGTAVSGFAK